MSVTHGCGIARNFVIENRLENLFFFFPKDSFLLLTMPDFRVYYLCSHTWLSAQKGPVDGSILCCHCLEILSSFCIRNPTV